MGSGTLQLIALEEELGQCSRCELKRVYASQYKRALFLLLRSV